MKKKDIFKIEYGDDCIYGYDKDGKEVYCENSDGYWRKSEYKDGKEIYCEYSNSFWWKKEYKNGKEVYCEDSNGSWWKLDDKGNEIEYRDKKYYLNSKEAKLKK